jgi:hypothetical protein
VIARKVGIEHSPGLCPAGTERLDLLGLPRLGASIGLIIASRGNPRICRVVAINPYDYAKGRGLAGNSWGRAFFSWQPAFLFSARP